MGVEDNILKQWLIIYVVMILGALNFTPFFLKNTVMAQVNSTYESASIEVNASVFTISPNFDPSLQNVVVGINTVRIYGSCSNKLIVKILDVNMLPIEEAWCYNHTFETIVTLKRTDNVFYAQHFAPGPVSRVSPKLTINYREDRDTMRPTLLPSSLSYVGLYDKLDILSSI